MSIARDASVPTPVSVGATGTITASPDATFSVSGPAVLWAVLAIGNYDGLARTYGMAWVGGTPANATAWVKVDEALNGSTHAVQIWRATCSGPLSNVSARGTFSASTTNAAVRLTIQPLTGSNTTPGATGRRTTNGTAVAASVAVAGVLPGSWLILGGCLEEPGAVTPVAGTTETGESVGLITAATGENTAGAGGSVTVGWSQNFTYGALLALEVTASGPVNEDLTDRALARETALDEPSVAVPGALGPEDRSSVSTGTQVGQALALATGQHVEFVIRAATSHREVLQGLVTAVALGQLRITIDGVVVATPSFDGDPFQTYNESVADVAMGLDVAEATIGLQPYQLPDDRFTARWATAGLRTLAAAAGVAKDRGSELFAGRPIHGTTATAGMTKAQVQAIIDAAASGSVVLFGDGDFPVLGDGGVRVNKPLTLRSLNPRGARFLRTDNANGRPLLLCGSDSETDVGTGSSVALIANAVPGNYYVDVGSLPTGLVVGDIVLLDELTDTTKWFFKPGQDQGWFNRLHRPQNEMMEVTAISGSAGNYRVTFDSPVTMPHRVSLTAQLTRRATPHVRNIGIENIRFEGGQDGGVVFSGAAYSWIKGSDVAGWHGGTVAEGVSFQNCFRCEGQGNQVRDAAEPNYGGWGYCIGFSHGTSEVAWQNNIMIRANKVMVGRGSGVGCVYADNYTDEALINFTTGDLQFPEVGINGSHYIGAHHILMEGNYGQNLDSDQTNGNSLYNTYFRNHASGKRLGAYVDPVLGGPWQDAEAARCASLFQNSWWMSFVGNVLGFPNMNAGTTPGGTGNAIPWVEFDNKSRGEWMRSPLGDPLGNYAAKAIWRLGYDGQAWNDPQDAVMVNGTLAQGRVIQDGNRDFLTGQQKWLTPGRGAALLPDSFYRDPGEKPVYFGAYDYPWVRPDDAVSPVRVLPAKARYEAGTPFAVIEDPARAIPMELLSRSVPATSSAGTAAHGQDASYGGPLWGFNRTQLGAGGTLTYDLSGVAAAKRQSIVVALYQGLGDGQQQLNFRALGDPNVYQNVATAYVLEGATSSSGPWTALASVTQNCQHFKVHRLAFAGYTWLRFRATAGTPYLDMDVYSAANGVTDGIAIFGDSITSNNFSDADVGAPPEWFSKAILAARPGFFPAAVGGGVPFMTSADAVSVLVTGSGGFTTGLDQAARITYAGVRYAALVYGVNDAGAGPAEGESFRANCQAIINAFRAQGQVVVIASPSWCNDGQRAPNIRSYWQAVGYHLPDWAAGTYALDATVWRGGRAYKATTAGTSVTGPTGTGTGIADGGTARWAYVPTLREDNAADPSVIGGPDLYSLFLNHPEWLSDGIHPNGAGAAQWKAAWVSWALARLY